MSHNIALNFEDGVTRFIEGTSRRDGRRRRLPPGHQHPARLPRRRLRHLQVPRASPALRRRLLHRGRADRGGGGRGLLRSTCQMRPKTDLVVAHRRLLGGLQDQGHRLPGRRRWRMEQLSDSTSIACRSSWRTPAGSHFLPGQYVNDPGAGQPDQRRSYSFSSPPGSDVASFLIRNMPGGLMSSYLTERAKPGDNADLHGPVWEASTCATSSGRCCCWRAAPGWRPSCRCWARLAETGCEQPIHLVYGVTNDGDLVEVETDSRTTPSRIPSFTFATCVADKGSNHPLKGYVTASSRGQST